MSSKVQSLKSIAQTPWLNLWELAYRHQERDATWIFASRQSDPKQILSELQTGQKNSDAVTIIPIIFDRCAGLFSLLVTKEYRPITGGYEYGFPAGLIDTAETPEAAARRELLEETGYEIVHIITESPSVYSSAGLTDECLSIIVAIVQKRGDQQLEEQEDIEVMTMPFDDLEDLCNLQGEFEGGNHGARTWSVFFALQVAAQFPTCILKDLISLWTTKESEEAK